MLLRIDRSFLHIVRCVSSARDEFPLLRRERVRTKDNSDCILYSDSPRSLQSRFVCSLSIECARIGE